MSDDSTNPFAAPQAEDLNDQKNRGGGLPLNEQPPITPCPKCGAEGATPAPYNWWRGRRAPTAAGHVVCPDCACEFNGETGVAYKPATSPWPLFIVAVIFFILYVLFNVFVLSL